MKNVEKLETLKTPVYDIQRDHQFKEILGHIDKIKNLQGPVYSIGDPKHHYQV